MTTEDLMSLSDTVTNKLIFVENLTGKISFSSGQQRESQFTQNAELLNSRSFFISSDNYL